MQRHRDSNPRPWRWRSTAIAELDTSRSMSIRTDLLDEQRIALGAGEDHVSGAAGRESIASRSATRRSSSSAPAVAGEDRPGPCERVVGGPRSCQPGTSCSATGDQPTAPAAPTRVAISGRRRSAEASSPSSCRRRRRRAGGPGWCWPMRLETALRCIEAAASRAPCAPDARRPPRRAAATGDG